MNLVKSSAKKAKAHTIYKLKDGTGVPGVTTLTGVMDKPALVAWANKIGLEGIKVREYVDDLARIGTLAHYMVECHVKSLIGEKSEPDLSDYTPNQIDLAENAFLKFLEWEKCRKVEYLACELSLVSEKHRFGGTVDLLAKVNGTRTLIDLKTCKAIYDEMETQVGGGYKLLLEENGFVIDDVRILRIGRDETEGFEDKPVRKLDLHRKRILLCRELYELNKEIKRK